MLNKVAALAQTKKMGVAGCMRWIAQVNARLIFIHFIVVLSGDLTSLPVGRLAPSSDHFAAGGAEDALSEASRRVASVRSIRLRINGLFDSGSKVSNRFIDASKAGIDAGPIFVSARRL